VGFLLSYVNVLAEFGWVLVGGIEDSAPGVQGVMGVDVEVEMEVLADAPGEYSFSTTGLSLFLIWKYRDLQNRPTSHPCSRDGKMLGLKSAVSEHAGVHALSARSRMWWSVKMARGSERTAYRRSERVLKCEIQMCTSFSSYVNVVGCSRVRIGTRGWRRRLSVWRPGGRGC
jgi:hypothetical protein